MFQILLWSLLSTFFTGLLPHWPADLVTWIFQFGLISNMVVSTLLFWSSSTLGRLATFHHSVVVDYRVPPDPWDFHTSLWLILGFPVCLACVGWLESLFHCVPLGAQLQLIFLGGRIWLSHLRSLLTFLPWDVWLFAEGSTGIFLYDPGAGFGLPGPCSGVVTPRYKRFKRGGRQLVWDTIRRPELPGPLPLVCLHGLGFCIALVLKSLRLQCVSFAESVAESVAGCSCIPLGVFDDPEDNTGTVSTDTGVPSLELESTRLRRDRLLSPPTPVVSSFILDWASDRFIITQVFFGVGLPLLWYLQGSIWVYAVVDFGFFLLTFGSLRAASYRVFEQGGSKHLEPSQSLAGDVAFTFASTTLSVFKTVILVFPSSPSSVVSTLALASSAALLLRAGPAVFFEWLGPSDLAVTAAATQHRPPLRPTCPTALTRVPSPSLWWDPLFAILHPGALQTVFAEGTVFELPPAAILGPSYPDLDKCSTILDAITLSPAMRRAIEEATEARQLSSADDLHPADAPPPEPPPTSSSWLDLVDPSRIVDVIKFTFDRRPLRVGCDLRRVLFRSYPARCFTGVLNGCPLIVDTGASVCLTPTRDDFITYSDCNVEIKDLSSKNKVAGRGLVQWTVLDRDGIPCSLQVEAFHVPHAEVRLLSPQRLLKAVGGTGFITNLRVGLTLGNGRKLQADFCKHSLLPILPMFDGPGVSGSPLDNVFSVETEHIKWYLAAENSLGRDPDCDILVPENKNLSDSEKEFLRWHERLSHASFSRIYLLMRTRNWLSSDVDGMSLHRGPFLSCKHKVVTADSFRRLRCVACLEAKSHMRSAGSKKSASDLAREKRKLTKAQFKGIIDGVNARLEGRDTSMVLKHGDLRPGDCISTDHYSSSAVGRLPDSYGKESAGYTCGTLFVDHASGKIFNFSQFTKETTETLQSKHALETSARLDGITIHKYHSDNGTFASAEFRSDCTRQSQVHDFSAPHSKFQNGVAERNIGTVVRWARANLLHLARHWPRGGYVYTRLWPFAIDYAIWVFNRLPRFDCGVCPNEIWTGTHCQPHDEFSRAHKFGCPVYVLDNDLADGKSIPRWHPRARLGMFLGFSKVHSSLAPLVLNLATGKVTVCFHAIFDDDFTTVVSTALDATRPLADAWEDIFKLDGDRELFLDPEELVDDSGLVVPLDPVWCPQDVTGGSLHDDSDGPVASRTRSGPSSSSEGASEGATEGASEGAVSSRLRSHHPIVAHSQPTATAREWGQVPPRLSRHLPTNRLQLQSPKRRLRAFLTSLPILQDCWSDVGDDFLALHQHIDRDPFDSRLVESFDPRVLSARASKYNEDNPSWSMAMQGDHQQEYYDAMGTEIHTLDDEMHCWDYVERTPNMKVLPSTWAFKCKRYPDGRIKKFKARFVVRGDCQIEGVDFFETWAPVAQWATVRTMMVLASKLQLKSAQCDITAAFVHAPLPPEEEIFVAQPRGLMRGHNLVLRLNKSLYGLKQAPRHFFSYLGERLEACGLTPSECDPCLFLSPDLIVVVYVDDLLVYARRDSDIASFVEKMKSLEVDIRKEGSAEGFLGVDVARDNSLTTLTQVGLTKRIIEALGLDPDMSRRVSVPADPKALGRDLNGEPAHGNFNYASVVGMLLYLCGHSRPDLAFAVHQCARYSFEPKRSHELALLRIGRYLKGTLDKGLILNPTEDLCLDCYPDADFAGLWGREDPQDPHCVRSRTGFLITLSGCPVVWSSKLQTEIALSTMEAEYIALSTACRSLLPVADLLKELGGCLGLPVGPSSHLHIGIHEDNAGCLILGKMEPRRMTPRSKHYAVKYHWFRSQIGPRRIKLYKIDTAEQLGDIFTKGLTQTQFEYLRKQIMGW